MYVILFYSFAAIALLAGIVVAFTRKIAYAALALLFMLSAIAGIYLMLGADLAGVAQLVICAGGVLPLVLFGLRLTAGSTGRMTEEEPPLKRSLWAIAGTSALLSVLLTIIWTNPVWRKSAAQAANTPSPTLAGIGGLFAGEHALLVFAGAVALVVAMVGAAMIVRSGRPVSDQEPERT
jgi:NADH-quinone oxidoreductase subunit J